MKKTILFILPTLQEVLSQEFRQVKYSLFPPLGLLTLAALVPDDKYRILIRDEHVESAIIDEPVDLVVMTVYISSAHRAYEISEYYRQRGAKVCLGGIHPSTLPEEALNHVNSVCIGPGESAFIEMLRDFEDDCLLPLYYGERGTDLTEVPLPRRDLLAREKYLVANTIIASRGCPYACDFCYKCSFWGNSYYKYRPLEEIRKELDSMKGRFVFFLDDNFLGNPMEVRKILPLLRERRFVWQAAASLEAAYVPGLLEEAYAAGCRSLFVGFESIIKESMLGANKGHNCRHDYADAIRRFHDAGIMLNGSFVYGFDHDDSGIFDRTVEFAIANKIETATFHILTPFPDTPVFTRLQKEGRILHRDWRKYDTRHAVFQPKQMSPEELEDGYWRSYREFYSYSSIIKRAWGLPNPAKRILYNIGWKKADPVWNLILKHRLTGYMLPLFEKILAAKTEPRAENRPFIVGAGPRVCP